MNTPTRSIAAATAALALMAGAAFAEFPERKVQIIYPWAPGTATYGVSQLIADAMGRELGQAMPVVAQPGSGGVKAFLSAMAEPEDGYTIIDGYVAPLVIAPMFGRAEWACEDFTPLHSATANAFAIAVRPNEDRWDDFPGFVEYLRANPGRTSYNGSGNSLPHLVAAKALRELDVLSQGVPYDDLGLGLKDLRAGVLDWIVINPGTYTANRDAVRILATLSELESVQAVFGGAPRAQDFGIDLGLSGLTPMGWNWWVVENGTPDDRVETLRAAMRAATQDPEVRERIEATGFVMTDYAPDRYLEICNAVRDELTEAVEAVKWEEEGLRALR